MEGWLSVDAAELRRALDVMSRVVPRNQWMSHAALWKEGRDAVLRIAGIEARVAAEGTWQHVIMTFARFFVVGPSLWPQAGSVSFLHDADHIETSGAHDTLRWRRRQQCWKRSSAQDWPRFVDQPWRFEPADLVLLPLHYTERDLEHSGLLAEWKEVVELVEEAPSVMRADAYTRDDCAIADAVHAVLKVGLDHLRAGLAGNITPVRVSWDHPSGDAGPAASRSAIDAISDPMTTCSRQEGGIPAAP